MRAIDADELIKFPHSESAGTDEQIENWIEECGLSDEGVIDRAKKLCWAVIDGFINLIKTEPTLTPPNEPLTLEELREMDGEPVWVKCLKPNKYIDPPTKWRILEKSIMGNFGVWDGECALIERNYGTDWLAYRRPPEGEEDT